MLKQLKFGIASVADQRARALAIAAGTAQRADDDPNVWFPSVSAAMRVLSDENMALLKYIRDERPESVNKLALALGKQPPNVSRSLHTMAQFGLVRMVKQGRVVKPEALAERVLVAIA